MAHPPASLLSLPREIRDIITTHLFTSPTGYITLIQRSNPSHPLITPVIASPQADYHSLRDSHIQSHNLISLAILRSCRQLYFECRDRLWELNTLLIASPDILHVCDPLAALPMRGFVRPKRVLIRLELFGSLSAKQTRALKILLRSWARSGALKELGIGFGALVYSKLLTGEELQVYLEGMGSNLLQGLECNA